MTPTSAPVVRLSAPGEVIAALPHLCGFVPTESVVVLSLHPPRSRVGLVVRLDLPQRSAAAQAADLLVDRVATDSPEQVVVVICTDRPGRLPHRALVDRLQQACADAGIPVRDALLTRAGRWWSYRCAEPACCPAEGTPVPAAQDSPRLGLLAAEGVLAGRQVLPDRAALVAGLAAPTGRAAEVAARAQDDAQGAWDADVRRRGQLATSAEAVARWSAALAAPRGADLDAAALVVALGHLPVRDRVLAWAGDRADELLDVLHRLAPQVTAPHEAAVCTLLAVTAWSRGDGALANVALDRALAGDPGYRLASLVRVGLDHAVPPEQVRRWLRRCASP